MAKRVFLIVLDSVGIGEEPDAADYGDVGSNTLRTCWRSGNLHVPNLQKLGLFNIEGVGCGEAVSAPIGSFARMQESSAGIGLVTEHPASCAALKLRDNLRREAVGIGRHRLF